MVMRRALVCTSLTGGPHPGIWQDPDAGPARPGPRSGLPAPRGESMTVARVVVVCQERVWRRVATYHGRSSDPVEAGQVCVVDNVRGNHGYGIALPAGTPRGADGGADGGAAGRIASTSAAADAIVIGPWMTARMMPFGSTKNWVGRAKTP